MIAEPVLRENRRRIVGHRRSGSGVDEPRQIWSILIAPVKETVINTEGPCFFTLRPNLAEANQPPIRLIGAKQTAREDPARRKGPRQGLRSGISTVLLPVSYGHNRFSVTWT
jgi:hypothetical protein